MTIHDYDTQKDQFLLTILPFNERPVLICSNHFELCNLMRVGHKQHIFHVSLAPTILSSGSIFIKSQARTLMSSLWAMSLGYVSGLRNNSLPAIKMFYTKM
jgi:hypothetical protein